jgi:NAD(P)H-hydrate repair Nnr-like enzyme with NAD(P)H-hydrate dehydratase domain
VNINKDPIPEPYVRADNLELLRRIAWEADTAKLLLRKAGFGCTGMGLLETVQQALAEIERKLEPAQAVIVDSDGNRIKWGDLPR